jgi:predicted secreted protein
VSTFLDQDITCRDCGQHWTRPVATLLDEPDDLDKARSDLRSDRFQQFACPGCGQRVIAARPLRWCDGRTRLWVAMLPDAAETEWRRWERQVATMAQWDIAQNSGTQDTSDDPGAWTLRLVFGLVALREKVLAHEAGLDDGILELLKQELLDAHPDLEAVAGQRLRLVDVAATLFSFAGRDAAGRWQGAASTRARYDALRRDPDVWGTERAALVEGPYVDLGRRLLGPDASR